MPFDAILKQEGNKKAGQVACSKWKQYTDKSSQFVETPGLPGKSPHRTCIRASGTISLSSLP